MASDVLVAVASDKQSDDLAFRLFGQLGLVLLDDLRLEAAGPVMRGVQFELADLALHGLGGRAFLAIGLIL